LSHKLETRNGAPEADPGGGSLGVDESPPLRDKEIFEVIVVGRGLNLGFYGLKTNPLGGSDD